MKKKTIFFLAVASVLFGANAVSASLWDYYKEQDLKFPTWEERIPTAESCGIPNYEGRVDQNIELEKCLEKIFEVNTPYLEVVELPIVSGPFDEFLGATPKRPTEYKTSLNEQKTEGHSGTTLKVSSVTTKDGNTLDTAVLGDLIVLSINPGASNSEVVVCTGLTTSTKTFSGCGFGYRFDNPTATSSANIKAHSPGEPVIISNTDTYLSQQYLTLDGDHTIAGALTFSGTNSYTGINTFANDVIFTTNSIWIGNNASSANKNIYARNGDTNLPFLRYDESANKWLVSNDGLNTIDFSSSTSSGLSASTTRGIGITNSFIHINASTTRGLTFGGDGYLYQITSSTGNISSNSNGLYLDGTDALTWTGAQTFSNNTTFATTTMTSSTVSIKFTSLGTATFATTTITDLSVTSSTITGTTTLNNVVVNGVADFIQWKYISSSTDATPTVPAGAKVAVVNVEGRDGNCGTVSKSQLTVFWQGVTSTAFTDMCDNTGDYYSASVVWNGPTVTISHSAQSGLTGQTQQTWFYK